jgi:hypothetical protein
MTVQVDVWLRGDEVASTRSVEGLVREPREWTDGDVKLVLEGMLKAMHELKHPSETPVVALRGLSWIVNPYDEGGVVIAIEITLGGAVAGPIDIDKTALETMITRVLRQQNPPVSPASPTIH